MSPTPKSVIFKDKCLQTISSVMASFFSVLLNHFLGRYSRIQCYHVKVPFKMPSSHSSNLAPFSYRFIVGKAPYSISSRGFRWFKGKTCISLSSLPWPLLLRGQRGFNVSVADKTTVCPGDVVPLDKYSGVKDKMVTSKITRLVWTWKQGWVQQEGEGDHGNTGWVLCNLINIGLLNV